jgi:hypothetical protein
MWSSSPPEFFMASPPSPSTPGSATVLSDGMKECRRLPHSCRAVSTVPATAARSERFDAHCSPVQRTSVPGHDSFERVGGVNRTGNCADSFP